MRSVQRKADFKTHLNPAFGYIDHVNCRESSIEISGWILDKDREFDSITVYIDGKRLGQCEKVLNEGVAKSCYRVGHAVKSGFWVKSKMPSSKIKDMIYICAVGSVRDQEVSKIETPYIKNISSVMSAPSEGLILRVTGQRNPNRYLMIGLRDYVNYWKTIINYVDPKSIDSVLDWGCGSGRIIGFFAKFSGITGLYACDIDDEAIRWGREYIENVDFKTISPWPPAGYNSNFFSVIFSYSVFTHLPKKVQLLWLEEIARILAPKGLFLTTVHGECLFEVNFPKHKVKNAIKEGIYDKLRDDTLDGIAPDKYYRAVYHTKEYIFNIWSKYFEILEYRERGAGNWQDLIVMRKRK